jgi:hypothetical protein
MVELLNVDASTGHTNCHGTVSVLGSSLGTSNYVDVVNAITNIVITGVLLEENSEVSLTKGKFVGHLSQQAAIQRFSRELPCGACPSVPGFSISENVISNSVWTLSGTLKVASNSQTSFVAKVVGIWKDGATAFTGSLKNVK